MKKTGKRQLAFKIKDIRADHRARYEWVTKQLGIDDVVFDAGCGVGYGSNMMAQRARSILAIDCEPEAISFAHKNWSHPKITFKTGNLDFLNLENGQKFDFVVAFEIIEHLVRPELFLTSVRHYITPTTKLFISSPNEQRTQHSVDLNSYHIRHFTTNDLGDLLEATGYQVEKIYSQDADSLSEGAEGSTIILQCTLGAVDEAKAPKADFLEMQAALSVAEKETNLRSYAVRHLQSKIRNLATMQETNAKNLISALDADLQKKVEAVLVKITEQDANIVDSIDKKFGQKLDRQLEILESRIERFPETLTPHFQRVHDDTLKARLGEFATELKQQQSALFEAKEAMLTGINNALNDQFIEVDRLRQVVAQTSERELLARHELHALGKDTDGIRAALAQAGEDNSELMLQNKALSGKINQLSAALRTQTFEIAKRKDILDQFKSLTRDYEKLTEERDLLRRDIAQLSDRIAQLQNNEQAQRRFFDPDRPTLAGLARLTLRHGLFIGILVKAPFNTLSNLLQLTALKLRK